MTAAIERQIILLESPERRPGSGLNAGVRAQDPDVRARLNCLMWSFMMTAKSIASGRFQVLISSASVANVSVGTAPAWTTRASVISVAMEE